MLLYCDFRFGVVGFVSSMAKRSGKRKKDMSFGSRRHVGDVHVLSLMIVPRTVSFRRRQFFVFPRKKRLVGGTSTSNQLLPLGREVALTLPASTTSFPSMLVVVRHQLFSTIDRSMGVDHAHHKGVLHESEATQTRFINES